MLDALARGLRNVRRPVEFFAPLADARGAPKVIDGDGVYALLSEAQRQLLIEVIQAARIGQDNDAAAARPVRIRAECREAVAIRGREYEILVLDRRARNRPYRRQGFAIVAHGGTSSA